MAESSKVKVQREVKQLRRQLRVIMKEFYGHLKCLQQVINNSEEVAKCRVLYGDIYTLWQRAWLTLRPGSPTSDLSEVKVLVQELWNKVDEFGHFLMCLTFELSTSISPEGIVEQQRKKRSVVNTSQKASSSSDTIVDVEDHLQHKISIEGGSRPRELRLAHDKLPQWVAKLMLGLSGQMVIQLLTAQTNDKSSTAKVALAVVKAANAVGFICLFLGLSICRRKSLASSANLLQRIGSVLVTIGFTLAMSADLPVNYLVICTLLLAAPVTVVLSAMQYLDLEKYPHVLEIVIISVFTSSGGELPSSSRDCLEIVFSLLICPQFCIVNIPQFLATGILKVTVSK